MQRGRGAEVQGSVEWGDNVLARGNNSPLCQRRLYRRNTDRIGNFKNGITAETLAPAIAGEHYGETE